jgi:hypothetical protein
MKIIVKQSPQHLLEAFCRHYCDRDLKAALSLFTEDALLWGTGADEVRRGSKEIEAQLTRDWSQSDGCKFVIENIETDPIDRNWVAATVTARVKIGEITQTLVLRGTIITKRENGKEKIRFFHSSFPAANQEAGESFPKTGS